MTKEDLRLSKLLRVYLICGCTISILGLLPFLVIEKDAFKWYPLIVFVVAVLWAPLTTLSLYLSSVFIHNYRWFNRIELNIISSCLMTAIHYSMICLREYLDKKEYFPKILCYFNDKGWHINGFWSIVLPALLSLIVFILVIILIDKIFTGKQVSSP